MDDYSTGMAAGKTRTPPRQARHEPVELSLGEHACLALLDEGVNHGWAIGTELAPDGELGRIWSLSRPLTYRAIEQLESKGMLRRQGRQGAGRERMQLSCTAQGRRAASRWLETPVEHLRDVRTELLLKLVLRRRRGLPLDALLRAQQRAFAEHVDALTVAHQGSDPVDIWRRESARAVRRFLDTALEQIAGHQPIQQRSALRLSARNQLHARITSVAHGGVMSTIKTVLPDGQSVTAVITRESVQDLDLAPGDEVLVIVKSTEVMLAKP